MRRPTPPSARVDPQRGAATDNTVKQRQASVSRVSPATAPTGGLRWRRAAGPQRPRMGRGVGRPRAPELFALRWTRLASLSAGKLNAVPARRAERATAGQPSRPQCGVQPDGRRESPCSQSVSSSPKGPCCVDGSIHPRLTSSADRRDDARLSSTTTMTTDRYAEVFQQSGLAVLLYNHRNFGGSDGEPRQAVNPWLQARGYRDAASFVADLPGVESGGLYQRHGSAEALAPKGDRRADRRRPLRGTARRNCGSAMSKTRSPSAGRSSGGDGGRSPTPSSWKAGRPRPT